MSTTEVRALTDDLGRPEVPDVAVLVVSYECEGFIQACLDSVVTTTRDLSVEAGVFDGRPHRALLRKPLLVDEQGFKEADESALRHLAELAEIEARSASRLIEHGEEGINLSTATLVFEAGQSARRR